MNKNLISNLSSCLVDSSNVLNHFSVSDLFAEMLELWFEKNWVLPDNVVMIPEEQAAIVSFSDSKGYLFNFASEF